MVNVNEKREQVKMEEELYFDPNNREKYNPKAACSMIMNAAIRLEKAGCTKVWVEPTLVMVDDYGHEDATIRVYGLRPERDDEWIKRVSREKSRRLMDFERFEMERNYWESSNGRKELEALRS